MNIKVLTVSDNISATLPLLNSLDKNKWDYHVIDTPFRGFGTKLIKTYEYLKQNPQVTEFIFCDAFDVFCFGVSEEVEWEIKNYFELPKTGGIIISGERGLWPPDMECNRDKYIKTNGGFDFPNSGLYYATSSAFIKCFEAFPVNYHDDDQRWFHNVFLSGIVDMWIDSESKIFQSYSFIEPDEYSYMDRPRNEKVGNMATFYHWNGQSMDTNLKELIENII
jgi:hypothetical protein